VRIRDGVVVTPSEDLRRLRIQRHDAVAGGQVQGKGFEASGDVVGRKVANRGRQWRMQSSEQMQRLGQAGDVR
jgi:hypothetical protein